MAMFAKDNYLNSLQDLCKTAFATKFSTYNVTKDKINITSIPLGTYYIMIMLPRSGKLKFASETYNDVKRKTFRCEIYVAGANSSACSFVSGKIGEWIDHNQDKFSVFGLKQVEVSEFLKIPDTKIYNSSSSPGAMEAWGATLSGTILL